MGMRTESSKRHCRWMASHKPIISFLNVRDGVVVVAAAATPSMLPSFQYRRFIYHLSENTFFVSHKKETKWEKNRMTPVMATCGCLRNIYCFSSLQQINSRSRRPIKFLIILFTSTANDLVFVLFRFTFTSFYPVFSHPSRFSFVPFPFFSAGVVRYAWADI